MTLTNLVFSPKSVTQFPASSVVGKGKSWMNFVIPFLQVSVNTLYNFPCTASFKLPNNSLRLRKHSLLRTVIKLTFFFYFFIFLAAILLVTSCQLFYSMEHGWFSQPPKRSHRGCCTLSILHTNPTRGIVNTDVFLSMNIPNSNTAFKNMRLWATGLILDMKKACRRHANRGETRWNWC